MEVKNPIKSKRVWGMLIISIAKAVSMYFPIAAPICEIVEMIGDAVLVHGMLVAETPLISPINPKKDEPTN